MPFFIDLFSVFGIIKPAREEKIYIKETGDSVMIVKCDIIRTKSCLDADDPKSCYDTYGLLFFCDGDDENKIIREVDDVTPDKEEIIRIRDIINRNQLDDIHINDVIYDFLS